MASFQLEIVTAERIVYSEQVDLLVAPGTDGELGILPNHSPLLTTLKAGEICVEQNDERNYIAVTGGFLEVIGNKATILADTAEYADEINEERAEEAMKRAEQRVESSTSAMDLERAVAAMRRSQVRLRVARRKRTSNITSPS